MGLKGLVFTIAIVGIIFTITMLLAIVLPFFVLKYHLAINLRREYERSNAQLALLALISSKYNDTYSMYRVLSERNSNGFDKLSQKLEAKVNLLTNSSCFKLVNETAVIYGNCEAFSNVGEVYMFRPYDQGLVEKVILVFG